MGQQHEVDFSKISSLLINAKHLLCQAKTVKGQKELYAQVGNTHFMVLLDGVIVHEGMQLYSAVETYNTIEI